MADKADHVAAANVLLLGALYADEMTLKRNQANQSNCSRTTTAPSIKVLY
jgi:hypothetical protein